jgi:hypothetical protein
MFTQLLRTELMANRLLLIVSIIGNALCLWSFSFKEATAISFSGASTLLYYVLIIVYSIGSNSEKRLRLYSQLPVTNRQVFFATWTFILALFCVHLCFWLVYFTVFEPEFATTQWQQLIAAGLSTVIFVLLIAIALDLGSFKPAYAQWVYITLLVSCAGLARMTDLGYSPFESSGAPHVSLSLSWIVGSPGVGTVGIASLISACLALLLIDYFVYTR